MDRKQVRYGLFKLTMAVLGLSSWVFFSFVMQSRPEDLPTADPLGALVRLPASLPAQLPAAVLGVESRVNEPIRMDVVQLNCWDMASPMDKGTGARWVRLTGRPCQSDPNSERVEVVNLSNGYGATVFNADARNLTTDYIPLESGRNEIQIRFAQESGAVVEHQFTVIRQ